MEKTIQIDGRDVRFKATGNTPRLYRSLFLRDIFADIAKLSKTLEKAQKESEDGESVLDVASLEVFENVAYTMAKQADSTIPGIDTWLDGFNVFSIYEVMPEIIDLWNLNTVQIAESKKNLAELTAK
jgi:hypothetical protein